MNQFLPDVARPKLVQRNELIHVESLSALPRPPRICQTLAQQIPGAFSSIDRLRFLGDALDEVEEDKRMVMRLHFEQFARHMVFLGASDMDAGGPASNDLIWYRVDGEKKPEVELGSIAASEMDVLILNLLSPYHLRELLQSYAVDFSLELLEASDSRPRRFRASVYVDGENLAISVRAIKSELRSLASLGLHPSIERAMLFDNIRDGLTLITGRYRIWKKYNPGCHHRCKQRSRRWPHRGIGQSHRICASFRSLYDSASRSGERRRIV